MRAFWAVATLFILCAATSTSSLFTIRASSAKKVQLFRKLQDSTCDQQDHPTATFEDKLSVLVKTSPILTLQSALSVFLTANVVSGELGFTTNTFQNLVRAKLCVLALSSKLSDVIRCFDVSEYHARSQYSDNDIMTYAKGEVMELVKNPLSMNIAFLTIMLLTGSRPGSITPFVIGELPTLARFLVIVATIAAPKSRPLYASITQTLFSSDDQIEGTETAQSASIDSLCENAAGIAEIFILSKVVVGLLRVTDGAPVRGFRDMIVLSVRLLLIQNFLLLRVTHLLRQDALASIVTALKDALPLQYVLSVTESFAGSAVLDSLRLLLDPAMRRKKLRSLLGRHNIIPVSSDDVQVTPEKDKVKETVSSLKSKAPSSVVKKRPQNTSGVKKKKKPAIVRQPKNGETKP